MKHLLRGVVRLACFPVDVLAYTLCVLLVLLRQADDLQRIQGLLVLFFRKRSFAERHWNYATTLGHVVISNRSFMPVLKMIDMVEHEKVHIRQLETVCTAWAGAALTLLALLALGLAPWAALLAVSPAAWFGFYLAGIFCAASEGKKPYLENVLEEQAYEHVQSTKPPPPAKA